MQCLLVARYLHHTIVEAWSSISNKHIEELELIDRCVLKFIIGAPAKTAYEVLHLETATIPLRHIISIRRMLYFQVIMKSLFRRGLMKSLQREFMKHNNIIHVKVTGLCF